MIPEIGQFALILALCLAGCQVLVGTLGVWRGQAEWMRFARCSAYLQSGLVILSFLILMLSFVVNDFSVAYIAENSNTALPLIYRMCAVWGAHEGSMLLWVFILGLWTIVVAFFARKFPLVTLTRVLVVLGCIAVGFYLFILMTSNPFLRYLPNFPVNGADLNPLLQDPGLVSHPPMLYIGYVGMAVPFAFAIAALWAGKFDASWARWARPWTTLAWCFLTLGIVLGSWWAYRELGWGGWWFWDPVENASFLPWLVATALLHSLMVSEKRNQFKSWTVLLAICAFSLSLIGTFLVRSGVLISVHAFAVDPRRGAFILKFLFLVIGVSLLIYAWRGRRLATRASFSVFSRESALLLNNMLLLVAMLTVLLGTLYPLLVDVLGWGKISVGAPYFNAVFIPIMIPLLFLMGFGPHFYWQHRHPRQFIRPLLWLMLVALLTACLLPLIFFKGHYQTMIGLFLAFWLILSTLYYRRCQGMNLRQWSVTFAHLGVAVTVIGVVLAHAYSEERDLRMHLGETAWLGPYAFQLQTVKKIVGPNFHAAEAKVLLTKNGRSLAILHPQYRVYDVAHSAMSKTAIAMSWRRDLYVALADPYKNNTWSMRIYYKPFVRWIWWGGILMVLGGLLAVFSRSRKPKKESADV